jgi:hypothetical protein
VFQRNILLLSSGDFLKMEGVCLLRTVAILDDLVYVWKYTVIKIQPEDGFILKRAVIYNWQNKIQPEDGFMKAKTL